MALISPAAEPYLEQMARLSKKYTEEQLRGGPYPCSCPSTSPTPAPQLVRVLRIPYLQSHEAHHPHRGGKLSTNTRPSNALAPFERTC